jgi:hypothetical protein
MGSFATGLISSETASQVVSSFPVFGDVVGDGFELVARYVVGVFVFGEQRRHHHGVGAVVEADVGQAGKNSSQLMSPSPILRCWCTRAGLPGGLVM